MNEQNAWFDGLAVKPANILLPAPFLDTSAYACVACDQFTSEPEYWREAETLARGKLSALHMILPECYLSESEARIPAVRQAMSAALEQGALSEQITRGMVLCARHLASGDIRLGLVLCVDLEQYDYAPDSMSPVRATEGTIAERIPPRLRVREDAPLELTHILLLHDDPSMTVVERLYERRDALRKVYDLPLMLGGGRAEGWAVEGDALRGVADAMRALYDPREGALQIAVGDGNHSLATARAHWLAVRDALPSEARAHHPARCALCELENLRSPALHFEPIHRVVTGVPREDILRALAQNGLSDAPGGQRVTVVTDAQKELCLTAPTHPLPVGTLQTMLDHMKADMPGFEIDYIHGMDALLDITRRTGGVGFALPAMDKGDLLPAVQRGGPLPRKTFSMGGARDKRYYIEARRLTN